MAEYLNRAFSVKFDFKNFTELVLHGEKNFPGARAQRFFGDHVDFIGQMSIIYLVVIFGLQKIMENQKAFDLKLPLAFWNLFLAIFSLCAFVRIIPEFFSVLFTEGLFDTYCYAYSYTSGQSGYWAYLFMISKLFEFVDTIFIVLRKRPLIFLHWYHHVLTFIYTWMGHITNPGYSRYGAIINSFVHSIMYTYYFSKTMDIQVPRFMSKCLTRLQISQFVISLAMLVHLFIAINFQGANCDMDWKAYSMALFIDVTYMFLFIQFFIQSYTKDTKKKTV